jgi:hypothetical protein
MYKKLLLVLILAIGLFACKKNKNNNACGTQTCTESFSVITFGFTDTDGKPTVIKDVMLINQRTGMAVPATSYAATVDLVPGAIIIATD